MYGMARAMKKRSIGRRLGGFFRIMRSLRERGLGVLGGTGGTGQWGLGSDGQTDSGGGSLKATSALDTLIELFRWRGME
jgi:hypothetical protein